MSGPLPIHEILPQLRQALNDARSAVLSAPPGSGKTTVVPLALLDASWLNNKTIIMLEPRRLAARLAASYMAAQRGETVGGLVGYQVRFDRQISAATRIEVVTEGILSRRLQDDPELRGVGLVIFDEFHERSLEGDLTLALCRDVMAGLRDDLRLLVMSATLDTGPISRLLGQAPVVIGGGSLYPVSVVHLSPKPSTDSSRPDHVAINTARGVRTALAEQRGDILAFLPGAGEIKQVGRLLADLAADQELVILPLYGELPLAEQNRAVQIDPYSRRRIILATTIAETSVTIEGISTVVDCGWKRVARFSPNSGLSRLETVRVSRAAATQRRGRAGRLGPGCCYRLWSMETEYGLQDFDRPEILEADLAPLALQLANWGINDPRQLQWLDQPPAGAFNQGRLLLTQLDGLDKDGRLTAMGRKMAGLPLHPRLAHMLLKSVELAGAPLACDLAALLSERDILQGATSSVDIEDRLQVLNQCRAAAGGAAVRALGVNPDACRRLAQVSRQLLSLLPGDRPQTAPQVSAAALLALAFPDRIGQLRPGSTTRYRLNSGRGVQLPPHDHLAATEFLAVGALDAAGREGRIFLAAALTRTEIFELFSSHLIEAEEIIWDEKSAAVVSRTVSRFGELVIAEKKLAAPPDDKVIQVLLAAIDSADLNLLDWTGEALSLQARVELVRRQQPAGGWPDCSRAALKKDLAVWLPPFLPSVRTLKQLKGLNLEMMLRSRLDWQQQQELDREAPTHIRVPSGSKVSVRYALGEPPVLAVRLQEMFGLAVTPAICGGLLPVTLHLLSPARRPLQITRDLAGFWNSSYHQVRKELKGRYPKHEWPDDPWQAMPTARAKPRK